MKKVMIVLLATMLAFSSAALSAQKIEDIPWDESHIKQLRAAGKHAMFRFFLHQKDPDNEMEWTESSISWDYAWYPIGDGKYELAVDYQSGPDIGFNTFYWRDTAGKITSQDFGTAGDASEDWYNGPGSADLNGDGQTETIDFADLQYDPPPQRTKFIPNGRWPQVYRLRNGQYVEASRDFPKFYENKILPELDKAMAKAPEEQSPTRYLAALIMCRDKILRVIGRDPTAGLTQARQWMTSPDPILVDDAKSVFQDIGGHEDDVRAAKVALDRASKNWPNKDW
jgi:hypothetical protein